MMDSKSCKGQYPTSRAEIRRIFKRYYGSARWASAQTGQHEATVSGWLRGKRVSTILDAEMPRLAQLLKDSKGACIHDANGPSVRSRIGRLRRKPKGGR